MARKNVTITLDEEVARWARIRAAEQNRSISGLVGDMLAERMRNENRYAAAMRQYLERLPCRLKDPGEGYPSRDELHG